MIKFSCLASIFFLSIIFPSLIAQGETIVSDPIFQSNRSQIEKFDNEKEIEHMNKDIEEKRQSEKEAHEEHYNNEILKNKPSEKFFINEIMVSGVKSLWQFQINRIIKPYKECYLDLNKIDEIRLKLQELYIKKGYITTQVYIKPQNLSNGMLRIEVIEGKIADIKLRQNGRQYKYHPKLFFAMPSIYVTKIFINPTLNLRALDIAIENINHLEANNASLKLQAGRQTGYSSIIINNKPKNKAWFNHNNDKFQFADRTRLTLGSENTGLAQSGRWRKVIIFSQEDILGSNDNFSWFSSSNLHKYSDIDSNANSFNYQIPFGKFRFTASYVKSDYLSGVHGLNRNFNLTGDTIINSQKIDYQAYLSKTNKTTIFTKLNSWNIKNFLEDAQIEVSSRKSTTIEVGLSSLSRFNKNKGYFYFTISHIKGLKANHAKIDVDGGSLPHNQFEKYRLNSIIGRNFNLGKFNFTFEQRTTGQYAKYTLYPQEQIFMGDRFSVRGFQDHYLTSDSGGFAQNELIYNVKSSKPKFISRFADNFKIFAAYDLGYVKPRHRENIVDGQNYGKLSGIVIGTRWNARHSAFELALAKPLSYPAGLKNVSKYFIYFSFKINFI